MTNPYKQDNGNKNETEFWLKILKKILKENIL